MIKQKHSARKRRGLRGKALILQSGRIRLVVYRSNMHISGQLVDLCELGNKILASCSSQDKELRASLADVCKLEQASLVGKLLGERAKAKGITEVAFDRSGYKYHGRVKALAEGAREAGLVF